MTPNLIEPGPASPGWEPGITEHLRALWRQRWLGLALALAAAGVTFGWLNPANGRYEAEAVVRVTVQDAVGPVYNEDQVSLAARTYAELAETAPLQAEAAGSAGLVIPTSDLGDRIQAEHSSPPGFVILTGAGPTPAEAVALAQAAADVLISRVENERAGPDTSDGADATANPGDGRLRAELVAPPEAPTSPEGPPVLLACLVVAAIAGLVAAEIGVAVRALRGLLPLSHTAERVSQLTGVPALGLGGNDKDRARLAVFLASSTGPGDLVVAQLSGPSSPAAAVVLAEACAGTGVRTLLVDADRPRPVLHQQLGLPPVPSLAEVLTGRRSLEESAVLTSREGLWVLPGDGSSNGWSSAASSAWPRAGGHFGRVVYSVTAAVGVHGIATVLTHTDARPVLVVDPLRTTSSELTRQVHLLGGPDRVAGILLADHSLNDRLLPQLVGGWKPPTPASTTGMHPILAETGSP